MPSQQPKNEDQLFRDKIDRKLDLLNEIIQIASLQDILERVIAMQAELERLAASIAAMKTIEQGSNALLRKLSQMIRDAAFSPDVAAKLTELADSVDATSAEMSAAVAENTPAAPVVTPVETPPETTPTP